MCCCRYGVSDAILKYLESVAALVVLLQVYPPPRISYNMSQAHCISDYRSIVSGQQATPLLR